MVINGVFDINEIAREINRQLAVYTDDVIEEVEKTAQALAKDGAKKLKVISPKLTGDYRKGWRATKIKGKWVVHNKTDY